MWRSCLTLAIIMAASPSAALASVDRSAVAEKHQSFESCLLDKALALEPSGAEVTEILAAAERACLNTKGDLASAAVSEATQRVRLAVMQQRSNARNFRLRG